MGLISKGFLRLVIVCFFLPSAVGAHAAEPYRIYLDADFKGAKASAVSIERGIRTALSEIGNALGERPVELVTLNHRGNSARSLANLKTFLADPYGLVVFAGLHSPPLLAHRQFINDNRILMLDPWAAAGPITRPPDGNNWIFRLSVDDTKAGGVIVTRAVDVRGLKRPALLLENTGWGKSNLRNMSASLSERGTGPAQVTWFDWGLGRTGAKILLRDIVKSGADSIYLVANAPEAKVVCEAMLDLEPSERLPIISHWGITGGDFPKVITSEMRSGLDLEFIQTSFSFMDMGDKSDPNAVFAAAQALFPEIRTPADITSPTGFIHAYDLTRLLIAAAVQCDLTGDALADRTQLRDALENLQQPVSGLIKTYERPFRPYSIDDRDAHEALEVEDFIFGRYGDDNAIYLIR